MAALSDLSLAVQIASACAMNCSLVSAGAEAVDVCAPVVAVEVVSSPPPQPASATAPVAASAVSGERGPCGHRIAASYRTSHCWEP